MNHEFMLPDTEATVLFGQVLGLVWHAELTRAGRAASLPVVLLYGDLGSGKTTLTRGLVQGLPGGEEAEVSSPSFTLCNVYPTCPELVHCDLYRGGDTLPEEAETALESGGLVIVEWAERLGLAPNGEAGGYLPERLDILLQPCQKQRLARLTSYGEAAARVLMELTRRWADIPS